MINPPENNQNFNALLVYLQQRCGFDFTAYRRSSLRQRIHTRMHAVGTAHLGAYQDYLEGHPDEFTRLFDLVVGLPVAQLQSPIIAVLYGVSASEEVRLEGTNSQGQTLQWRVTCTPLREASEQINGVILSIEMWQSSEPL